MFSVAVVVNNECEFEELLWGRGLSNFSYICDEDLGEDLMLFIEDVFGDKVHNIDEINDYLANKLDVNLFIATHILLNDLWDIDELMKFAYQLGYSEAHDKIGEFMASGNDEELWSYLNDNFSNHNLNKVFSVIVSIELDDIVDI